MLQRHEPGGRLALAADALDYDQRLGAERYEHAKRAIAFTLLLLLLPDAAAGCTCCLLLFVAT